MKKINFETTFLIPAVAAPQAKDADSDDDGLTDGEEARLPTHPTCGHPLESLPILFNHLVVSCFPLLIVLTGSV